MGGIHLHNHKERLSCLVSAFEETVLQAKTVTEVNNVMTTLPWALLRGWQEKIRNILNYIK